MRLEGVPARDLWGLAWLKSRKRRAYLIAHLALGCSAAHRGQGDLYTQGDRELVEAEHVPLSKRKGGE